VTALLPLTGIFVTAFVVGFSGALMPGPLLAFTVSEASRRGPWVGPLAILGHALLEGALVAGVALGLAGVLQREAVAVTVSVVGGGFMVWMGLDMVRLSPRMALDPAAAGASRLHPVAAGALVSLANPYWTMWWATIGMSYVLAGLAYGAFGVCVFFLGHILSDLVWYSAVSVASWRGVRVLPPPVYRRVILACGLAMAAFGAAFLGSGAGRML
jgi:threonine/homoserine/homoserine lactone efflux protein